MRIVISGNHVDIGDSLREHMTGVIESSIMKFFEYAIKTQVIFSKHNHLFKTVIIVNEGTGSGAIVKSNAQHSDPYQCFNDAITKLTNQLKKYKDKIKNHHKKKIDLDVFLESKKYIISAEELISEENAPVIIAEKPFKIEKMSVAEAVAHMDLMDLPAYMFINSQTALMNFIYYRKDGNISWIA